MTTPAGWYDDGRGAMRWWDGSQWTDHTTPLVSSAPVPAGIGADSSSPTTPTGPTAPTPPYVMPSDTAAYPGAYRPYDPDAAAAVYAVQPPPTRSHAWIWWTVGGVVGLGIVVTAIILIPLLLLGVADGAAPPSPSSGTSVDGEGTSDEESDAPTSADEEAAVAAVELYDRAWRLSDCDDFFAATTPGFREYMEMPDCESFYSASRSFMDVVDDFQTEIREVETVGGAIAVSVTESYAYLYDEEGVELAEPEEVSDRWEYMVVEVDGRWAVDDAFFD